VFDATVALLRAGIVEGLHIFEMPCPWTFDMYVIHHHPPYRHHRHNLHHHHHHPL
jgi:hypothetical protein